MPTENRIKSVLFAYSSVNSPFPQLQFASGLPNGNVYNNTAAVCNQSHFFKVILLYHSAYFNSLCKLIRNRTWNWFVNYRIYLINYTYLSSFIVRSKKMTERLRHLFILFWKAMIQIIICLSLLLFEETVLFRNDYI